MERFGIKLSAAEWEVLGIGVSHYVDGGGTAIRFFCDGDGYTEPLTTLTVNLVEYGYEPDEGCIFVKDYGENEGVAEQLVQKGWLTPTGLTVYIGYETRIEVSEYRLAGELKDFVENIDLDAEYVELEPESNPEWAVEPKTVPSGARS